MPYDWPILTVGVKQVIRDLQLEDPTTRSRRERRLKGIFLLSVFITIIPTCLLCQIKVKLLTMNSKGPYPSSKKKKKKTPLLVDVLHKTQIIRHFHFLVAKKRQGNVQKNCDKRAKLLSRL